MLRNWHHRQFCITHCNMTKIASSHQHHSHGRSQESEEAVRLYQIYCNWPKQSNLTNFHAITKLFQNKQLLITGSTSLCHAKLCGHDHSTDTETQPLPKKKHKPKNSAYCFGTSSKRIFSSMGSSPSVAMATGKLTLKSKWNWTPGGGFRRKFRLSW